MKEHPILFNQEMVKAILEGRKTQTRRVLKKQPLDCLPMNVPNEWVILTERNPNHGMVMKCRYSQVGSRLWVRETFRHFADGNMFYKADNDDRNPVKGWTPSIFMPRWASRITLEITDIRVQRLWEITDEDAKAEGIGVNEPLVFNDSYKDSYAWLWDKINGKKHPWILNEFVWVISFKRV